ncbi:MAG: hypothetical protein ABI791_07655 [Acidobacteriota bacterium]
MGSSLRFWHDEILRRAVCSGEGNVRGLPADRRGDPASRERISQNRRPDPKFYFPI